MKIHDPKNKWPIKTLWAFLSEDADGNQGIIAGGCYDSDSGIVVPRMIPLVTSSEALLPQMREMAAVAKRLTDKKIVLYKFTAREKVEEVL